MIYLDTFGAFGGVGRCSLELLPHLARQLGNVTLAGRSHVVDSYRGKWAPGSPIHFCNLEQPRFHPEALAIRALNQVKPASSLLIQLLARRARRMTNDASPPLINYPQDFEAPGHTSVFDILIHDLNWLRYPGNFQNAQTLDRQARAWIERARLVFTNSEFTRDEIISTHRVEPARVIAAPLAPPEGLFGQPAPESPGLLNRFGLKPGHYFFYPAVAGCHKGHDILADALEAASPGSVLPVVLTMPLALDRHPAPLHPFLAPILVKLQALERAGKIIAAASLPWPDLLAIASRSRAYVLPSLYEGFGFPLVEAMSLGKSAICSDIPAFREIMARYGSLLHAKTFPAGESSVLHDLLVTASRNSAQSLDHVRAEDPALHWGWAHTAAVISDALETIESS